jgi:hypothetical protein
MVHHAGDVRAGIVDGQVADRVEVVAQGPSNVTGLRKIIALALSQQERGLLGKKLIDGGAPEITM